MKMKAPTIKPQNIPVARLRESIAAGHNSTAKIRERLQCDGKQLESVLAYHRKAGRMKCNGGVWSFTDSEIL